MTKMRKIIGTSMLTLSLVVVGLFMVCSGRMQRVQLEDDSYGQAEDEAYKEDLLKRLDVLDNEGQEGDAQESAESKSNAEAQSSNSDDATFASSESRTSKANEAESFLTPELFQGMNAEVKQLETLKADKDRTIDSLRAEMEEKNYQAAALQTTFKTKKITSKPLPGDADNSALYNSDYGLAYQDALDDFYVRRFDSAIRKFRELLRTNDRHQLADNCQYWIGECYFAMGKYYEAVAEFQKVYVFENSNKTNDAQLMIGIAFFKSGEKDLARAELSMLLSFGPQTASAKKAQRYLKMLESA
ncbi:MAG: tetratricopeptide repeat protein [candidate division KSB1 bacterium]|nr:tetratricopeptide repeat protein [candidate division KSB1 bacterium]MDZ7303321.1 tetratricopeptide repeat protein [candidate division KSB1 bacterium]MDZ7310429.1 tetratricopeptide repeat protein [candidate division KSB1 bacterium]